MEQLVIAGLLYLIVIAIVLAIKPRFMFTESGSWKEFGIGRNPATHTCIPFWLFAILWALISYIVTTVIFALRAKPSTAVMNNKVNVVDEVLEVDQDELTPPTPAPSTKRVRRSRGLATELPGGYYVLNTAATEASGGIPKYVYLGQGLPT